MPTDDERREVARRLREVEGYAIPGRRVADHPITGEVIAAAVMYDLPDVKGLLGRLADLIEPGCDRRAERTCRNLNPPSCRDFECSECGESSEFTPGFMPNYCPNCGARVEEASDDADR